LRRRLLQLREKPKTCAKLIVEKDFFNCKKSRKLQGILKDNPDIGERLIKIAV